MVEVNQIAIVNLVGLDKDPESGKETAYYQVINPTGLVGQKSSGIKSPVYTYEVEADTSGGVASQTLELLPRRPFYDHYQALIVTERFARDGVREMLNFVEKQPSRRSATYLLVSESPIKEMMNTYIPLERLPGRNLHNIITIQSKYTDQANRKSRVKDLIENLDSGVLTVLPIVKLSDSQATPDTNRYEQMNAGEGIIVLGGGAVFKHDRMIGKLNTEELPLYYLLNERIGVLQQTLLVNRQDVDIQAPGTTVRKSLTLESGRPVLTIDILASMHIVDNDQNVRLTVQNLGEIKSHFNRQVSDSITAFYKKMLSSGWDILSIEQQIKHKRGKEWADVKTDSGIWKETKLKLTVNSTIKGIGNTIDPYRERPVRGSDGERTN